ncbi:MAG: hypothetical protein QXU18_04335 [Thermoplasmatales archaeon]
MAEVSSTSLPFAFNSGYLFELIIAIIILLGIIRGINGRRYTKARVLRTPVIYLLFTLAAVFLTSMPNIYAQLMILLLPIGIPIGTSFGKDVRFFSKNDVLYYKRSPFILILWAIALIARAAIELFSLNSLLAIIVFNALLSFITGMLLGEAVHILRTNKQETNVQNKTSSDLVGGR